ncbi:LacI family DNA-binding transcriptional regulator [Tessaracoccus sp. Y1736]
MSSEAARVTRGATRDDVARLAGVSSAVVSYVVNNGPRPVAPATRARVLDAIDKLGYRPNAAARSLIMGRSDLVGLIVPDVRNPYFAALAQAVEVEARAQGVNLVLAQGPTGHLDQLIESLSGHLVAGIITAAVPEPAAMAVVLRNKITMVRLSLVPPDVDDTSVYPDFYAGGREAVRHLVEVHGHRRIALIAGSDTLDNHRVVDDRERAWRDVLGEAGLPTDALLRVNWSSAGGREAASRLVRDFPDCTAVFTMSDQQAIGLIAGLNALGRTVPDDIALTSFDGSPEAEFTVPPLTTAGVPMGAMAKAAVRQLLHPGGAGQVFRPELILRTSCGC